MNQRVNREICPPQVAEQKKELENREITIRAIQRNFEQLSTLCQQVAHREHPLARLTGSLKLLCGAGQGSNHEFAEEARGDREESG